MIITLAQLTLDHVQSVKGKYHATATEVKRIREIIASGKLATHTQFKINRKDFFFSIEDENIVVKVGDKWTYTWGGQPEYRLSTVYVNLKEGFTVLSQDEVNAIAKKEQQRQNETEAIIALCDAQYEGQIITIDQKWDASSLTCDVLEGWVGKSSPLPEPEVKEDLTAKLLDISHRLGRTFEGNDIASDIRFAEVVVLCNNNDELFWECRGSWYEGNKATKRQNQPDIPAIEKIIIHWSEASDIENTEFTSAAAAMEEMRSWYGNHPENLPQKGQGYDKTSVTIEFSDGEEYTMRLDICADDDDGNPFASENVFYSHYLAWLESLKDGAWAKDDTHRQKNVKKWSVFLDYDWGTGLEPIFPNVVSIKRSQVIADHVKSRYELWVTGLLEKGESHKILSFEDWKAKKQENKALTAQQKREKEEKARLLNEQSETLNQIRRIEGWGMTYSAYLKWCERWEKLPLSQELFHHAMKQLKVKYSI